MLVRTRRFPTAARSRPLSSRASPGTRGTRTGTRTDAALNPAPAQALTRRDAARGALFVGALLAVAYADALVGGKALAPGVVLPGVLPSGPVGATSPSPPVPYADGVAAYVDEPLAVVVSRSWARGEPPLWNPYNGGGAPLLGNMQSAPLSPLRIPTLLFPQSALARDLGYLLRLFVAGWFTFLFLRNRGLSLPASGAGAAGYALTGYLTLLLPMHNLGVEVWLPAACFAVDRAGARRSPLALFGVGAAFWAAGVGGQPQATFLLAGFVGAHALSQWRRFGGERVLRIGVAAALGLAAAAPALFPAIEYMRRASSFAEFPRGQDHYTLAALPGAFIPGWCRASSPPGGVSPFAPFPIGFAVTAFACVALRRRERRLPTWLFSAVALLYLLQVFGAPILSKAIGSLPLLRDTRIYKYGTNEFAFAAACLAAVGVDRLVVARPRAGMLAALAVCAELILAIPRTRPDRVPPYEPAPYIEFLKKQEGPFRTFGILGALPPNVNAVFGIEDVRIHEGLLDARFDLFRRHFLDPNARSPVFDGSNIGEYTRRDNEIALTEARRFQHNSLLEWAAAQEPTALDLADESRMRWFDLLNVRFVLFGPDQFELARSLVTRLPARYRIAHDPGATTNDLLVLENLPAFPRAWLVRQRTSCGFSAQAALEALSAPGFDIREGVVLELTDVDGVSPPTPSAVRFVERTDRSATLSVESGLPAFLVVSETYYPGWQATVDGYLTPIFRANVFLRAIDVPAGAHEVRFEYRPRSWTVGLAVGGAAAALLVLVSLSSGRRKV